MNQQQLQDLIEGGEILEALTLVISEAVEIEVITCIDNADLDQVQPSTSNNCLHTRLNLFTGMVDHEIDLKLIDNPAYSELQRWHTKQVRQKQNSLVDNLANLEKLRRLFLSRN